MNTDSPTEIQEQAYYQADGHTHDNAGKIMGEMHSVHGDEASGVTHRCQKVGDETPFSFSQVLYAQFMYPFIEFLVD